MSKPQFIVVNVLGLIALVLIGLWATQGSTFAFLSSLEQSERAVSEKKIGDIGNYLFVPNRGSAVFGAALIIAFPAFADEFRLGDMTVSEPFARASAGPAKAGAAYLTIINEGAESDLLIAASTTAANNAQVHATTMVDGVMKMRRVKAVEINPGEPTVLRPGGLHLMLMGLRSPLVKGQKFALALTFEKAGTIDIEVPVLGVAATEARDDHGEGEKDLEAM